ncbi:TIGR03086 family metal-binding protein [Streptomyces sp. NPDC059355]|uniref:TIGR03086 family metal-binding protein n=1 Tax=Streptomyces sp. NPDC059355 TaxID=3346811 RepID=UPI00367F1640
MVTVSAHPGPWQGRKAFRRALAAVRPRRRPPPHSRTGAIITFQDIQLLEKALTHAAQLLGNVTPAQYGQPTPCDDFDVRALANHLVAGNPYYVVLAQGGAPEFSLFAIDRIGERQPGEVYAEGAKEVLAAWQTPGALQRRMPLPGGGSGPRLADLHLLEAVLHGWDLATATGQDRAGDPDAVEAVFRTWYGNHPDEIRPQAAMFGSSEAAPEDAPALDRLAAYFGRTV